MDLLENLKIFRRVAEKHSFSGVAQEFAVKQSTISKAIAALEADLGVQLFLRSTRGVTLTREGQALLNKGAPVLDQLETVLAEVKNQKLLLQGQLKVASSLAFARLILTPLLESFYRQHPNIKFNFQLGDGFSNLIEEGIDLAIRLGPLEDSSLKAIPLGTWERGIYAAPSYLEEMGIPDVVDDLLTHRLVFYNRSASKAEWTFTDSAGVIKKMPFEPFMQSDSSDFLREAIIAGIGIGYAPTWMMIEPERNGQLLRLLQPFTQAAYPINMVTAGSVISAKQRELIRYLQQAFKAVPELNVMGSRREV